MPLLTPAELKVHIPSIEGNGEDAVLADLIAESEGLMASYAGWPLDDDNEQTFAESTYTFFLSSPAFLQPSALCICVHPLTVTSVEVGTTGAYVLLTEGVDYEVDGDEGLILLLPTATITEWPTVFRGIRVVVEAGYATAPAALRMMIVATARHLWGLRHTAGEESWSVGGDSASLVDAQALIPMAVKELLDKSWRLC